MLWSRHRHAPWYLGGMSFAESSFFPIPPDVMLAPMSLAQPARAWWFALLTTLTSVAGGLFGYAIGHRADQWAARSSTSAISSVSSCRARTIARPATQTWLTWLPAPVYTNCDTGSYTGH